jgi:hypothetical protein
MVVARVRDEVLYTFFAAPSTPLRSCQTLVLANMRQAPRPLCYPLAGTLLLAADWPHAEIREYSVKDPHLRHWVHSTTTWPLSSAHRRLLLLTAISPARVRIHLRHRFTLRFSSIRGAQGRPLLGPSPALIVVSVSTPPLTPPLRFFQGKCCLSIRNEEGGG